MVDRKVTIACSPPGNQVQSPQPATQPPGVSAASAAKAPSPGAPVPVRQRHQLPGGAGGRSGGRPTALADPQPEPSDLHSGLSLTVRNGEKRGESRVVEGERGACNLFLNFTVHDVKAFGY